jgi:ribosomal protein L7Ae-like RNA K-turn-binding protein
VSEETKLLPQPAPAPSDADDGADSSSEGSLASGAEASNNFVSEATAEDAAPSAAVERLYPFVLKARALIVGRDTLARSKGRLHFILITMDVSENSRAQILKDFAHYPVVQVYTEADLEKFFGLKGTKVLGFVKSGLAQSIYAELKAHRLNKPARSEPPTPASDPQRTKTRNGPQN